MSPVQNVSATDRYVRLRWLALGGHALALTAAALLGFQLDVPALGAVLFIEVATAAWLSLRRPYVHGDASRWLVAIMLLDAGLLVALLYLTGGPHNPMSVVVMVNVALAAVLLPPSRATLVTLSLIHI